MTLVLTAGVLWSFQALIIRQIAEAGSWTVLAWRSAAMVPVLLGFLAWRAGGSPLPAIRRAGVSGILGGLGLIAAMGGAILAFQSTTVANAAFLLAASPFLAAVLGWAVLGERVAQQTWGAIALALVGIVVMVWEGLAAGALVGNVAALVSALGFAVFTVSLRWRRLDDTLPSALLGALFSILAGALVASQTGQPLLVPMSDVLWCVLMGVLTMSGGMLLYTLGSKVVPAAELALLSNTEVMLAPFWVWLLLGETASPNTFVGGAILLVAIVCNGLSGARRLARACGA